ncbi:MAG: hypothetical protein CVU03_05745 [Bacteroidetes bacterium HGW-Bacteroidetes-2]|jgi:uncharacterized membrane protein YqjE|nr:MAG: hypothetical protein CVU03_05745 [Bacteroidetes bacterium HGW-Bacteroidetes-2]
MENQNNQVMTTSEWVITLLITAIPLVGLIMLFVWAFGSTTNLNKANWAKALLIWYAILIVIYLLIIMLFGAAMFGFMNT